MKKIFSLLIILSLAIGSFAQKNKNKFVEIETTMGKIKIELFADVPQHSENFLKLVKDGFYDSLLFHRVIPSFMIQGGDPDSKNALDGQMLGNGDVGYKVPAEFMVPKYYHKKGALAAARDNNPEKASSGCQFYIVVGRTFTDQDLTTMEQRGGFTYSEQAKKDYKTIGGTPHLDNGYTVFGKVISGTQTIDRIRKIPTMVAPAPKFGRMADVPTTAVVIESATVLK